MITKSYRCRLYPNKEQAAFIESTFCACRWIWNNALATKMEMWESQGIDIPINDLMLMVTKLRKVYPWLRVPPSQALQQTLRDLNAAYMNFFRGLRKGEKIGYPKFKRKGNRTQSYRTQADNRCVIDARHLKLPKIARIKCRITQPIRGRVVNVTVKRVPSGKYYAIICCVDVPNADFPVGEKDIIGVDAGLKDLMVCSDGTKVPNGRFLRNSSKQLARRHRKLDRKKKGSKNWEKQRIKVARAYEKTVNQRKDAIHKATIRAVRESQAIAVEDLNVAGIGRNRHMAKAVDDTGMSEMFRQLQYKCDWYGRDFIKIDRWFPSSKTCSSCGYVLDHLALRQREWDCPECGAHHDRDINAAINIAREGKRLLAM